MKLINIVMKFLFISIVLCSNMAIAAPLVGTTGSESGDKWQSSWLNLRPNKSFNENDELYIAVQGNAENVIVRLLPASSTPDSSAGIEGSVRSVPENGVIRVVLSRDHLDIKQISIHAGQEAWEIQLGEHNGTITLISVDHQRP